jgi:hypothetical protein
MSKVDVYRQELRRMDQKDQWDGFLLKESGLPGRRGNIELAQACADEGEQELFERYVTYGPELAPTNSPEEFLMFCGVLGLGKLLAEGDLSWLPYLRQYSIDPRWRTREAVAMSLQRLGSANFGILVREMVKWSKGSPLERRAAAAGLCEPALLTEKDRVLPVIRVLDQITESIVEEQDRKNDEFKALRKGMGYCWSVAVAACPEIGKPAMTKWLETDDTDIRWIMKENLKKRRLERMDAEWVEKSKMFFG